MQEIPKLTTESNEIKKEEKKSYINYISFKTTLKNKTKQKKKPNRDCNGNQISTDSRQ